MSPSSVVIAQYNLGCPVWSCSWSKRNSWDLYAGLHDGRLVKIDIRCAGGSSSGGLSSAVMDLGRPGVGGACRMPLHTVVAMGDLDRGRQAERAAAGQEGSDLGWEMGGKKDFECLVSAVGLGVWGLPLNSQRSSG